LEITSTFNPAEKANSPSVLLGQSIRDLRGMSKSFYPDRDITSEDGFIEALHAMLTIFWPNTTTQVIVTGLKKEIQSEIILIIFKMIKEILTRVKEFGTAPAEMTMSYGDNGVKFIIGYGDRELSFIIQSEEMDAGADLTLKQRAKLIKGRLSIAKSKAGTNQLKLSSPFKTTLYE